MGNKKDTARGGYTGGTDEQNLPPDGTPPAADRQTGYNPPDPAAAARALLACYKILRDAARDAERTEPLPANDADHPHPKRQEPDDGRT